MSGQVDTPGQRSCAHQTFDMSISKESLHQVPILSQHTSVVGGKTFGKQLPERFVPRPRYLKYKPVNNFNCIDANVIVGDV